MVVRVRDTLLFQVFPICFKRTPLNDCRARAGGSALVGLRDPRAGVFAVVQGQRANLGSNAKSSADDQLGVAAGLYIAGSSRLVAGVVRDGARPGAAPGILRRESRRDQLLVVLWSESRVWRPSEDRADGAQERDFRLLAREAAPHGDLYFEDFDDYWAEAFEREGLRYDRVPARVSESGDFLVSFGEPIGRVALDALAIDAREEARQECDAHPERAPAEAPERIRNWNRSL